MIHQAPHEVARRCYSFDRSAYDLAARKRQAFGVADLSTGINPQPAASPSTPLTIISSTSVKLWLDSQLGAGANTWADQSGTGNNFTEATHPPALTTVGGVPCYLGNGTNQFLNCSTITLTAGQWYWLIARQVSWTSNASLCGGPGAEATIYQTGASPSLSAYNGSGVANGAATIGAWFRMAFLTTSGGSDYFQIGSNVVTASPSNNTATGWNLFARQSGTLFGNFAIAAIVVCPALPTTAERSSLDSYGASRWSGVSF